MCRDRPEEIETEIAAFLQRERNEFNHFRFVLETRGEQKTVVPVIAVGVHSPAALSQITLHVSACQL